MTLYILALFAISASPLLLLRRDLPHATYATAIGERREITLPDKTRLLLNTNSKVLVQYTASKREIHVLEGEVMVTVHHQPRWPFQARVGDDVVQDWGTQFDIRVIPNGSTIVVTQGAVIVHHVHDVLRERVGPPGNRSLFAEADSDSYRPVRLAAGDEVRISSATDRHIIAESAHLSPDELASRIAWKSGFLQFSGQTLEDAVAEFSRYTPLRIEVDPAITHLRLGGRFEPTDPISFVRSLQEIGVISDADSARADGQVIHLRPDESSARTRSSSHQ